MAYNYKKYTIGILLIALCATGVFLFLKYKKEQPTFDLNKDSVLFGSYSYGQYSLSQVDAKDYRLIKKVDITKGWTDKIFKNDDKIFIPLNYKPDMTFRENRVMVYDLSNNKQTEVKVGYMPHYIFFKNGNAYVLCEEDGTSPSLYRIDSNLHAKKLFTIKNGGLISGAVFDGENIFFNSLVENEKNYYPTLVKVDLKGKKQIKTLVKANLGINNLFLEGDKLIMGLQSPSDESPLVVYDKNSLEKLPSLNYKGNMVGDIVKVKEDVIAVSNYSDFAQKGNDVEIIDIKENKIIKKIHANYLAERIGYINGDLVVVDNLKSKLEIFNDKKPKNEIRKVPTQVSNLIHIN